MQDILAFIGVAPGPANIFLNTVFWILNLHILTDF